MNAAAISPAVAATPLGVALKELATWFKNTPKGVEAHIGARTATIRDWERGAKSPSEEQLFKLQRGLIKLAHYFDDLPLESADDTTRRNEWHQKWEGLARNVDPENYVAAWRKEANDATTKHRGEWLPVGVHVAPFRGEDGSIMLVKVDQNGAIVTMARAIVEFSETMTPVFYARGVHLAPWRPKGTTWGFVLLAIDSERRIRAQANLTTTYPGTPLLDAKQDLEALLDAIDPPATDSRSEWRDTGSGDDWDDDIDDPKYDEWKDGGSR